jgi:hypothetical protein
MASATAVELMVSLIQHPQGYVSCARGFSVHSPCPRESQKGTDQRLALLGFLRLLIWQPGTPARRNENLLLLAWSHISCGGSWLSSKPC